MTEIYEFLPQAVINRPPAFFIARGLKFKQRWDDLDYYDITELVIEDQPVALFHYRGSPQSETSVFLPETVGLQQIGEILEKLLGKFDLPAEAITWKRTNTEAPF